MIQKHHQEDISGTSDLIEEISNISELPRPKRICILNRKTREKREQNSISQVSIRNFLIFPSTILSFLSELSSMDGFGNTIYNHSGKIDRFRKLFGKLLTNSLNNMIFRRPKYHRTIYFCVKYNIPVCHIS